MVLNNDIQTRKPGDTKPSEFFRSTLNGTEKQVFMTLAKLVHTPDMKNGGYKVFYDDKGRKDELTPAPNWNQPGKQTPSKRLDNLAWKIGNQGKQTFKYMPAVVPLLTRNKHGAMPICLEVDNPTEQSIESIVAQLKTILKTKHIIAIPSATDGRFHIWVLIQPLPDDITKQVKGKWKVLDWTLDGKTSDEVKGYASNHRLTLHSQERAKAWFNWWKSIQDQQGIPNETFQKVLKSGQSNGKAHVSANTNPINQRKSVRQDIQETNGLIEKLKKRDDLQSTIDDLQENIERSNSNIERTNKLAKQEIQDAKKAIKDAIKLPPSKAQSVKLGKESKIQAIKRKQKRLASEEAEKQSKWQSRINKHREAIDNLQIPDANKDAKLEDAESKLTALLEVESGLRQEIQESRNSEIPQSTEELIELIWKENDHRFWVDGSQYWHVHTEAELVQKVSHAQIKRFIESRYESMLEEIFMENKARAEEKSPYISTDYAIQTAIKRMERRRVNGVIDAPFQPRFIKANEEVVTPTLNTSNLKLAFLQKDGTPKITDPTIYANSAHMKKLNEMCGDGLDAYLDNKARHYANLWHGKFKWPKPNPGFRDKVVIFIGRKDVGKSINHFCYSLLFSMEGAANLTNWLGGVVQFNDGIQMPVIAYDDPRAKNRTGQYGNQYLEQLFSAVSSGTADWNSKNIKPRQVPFHALVFACANPANQDAVLPYNTSSDVMEKVLLFRIHDDCPKTTHEEAQQFIQDAKAMPAFLLDRFEKMEDKTMRFIKAEWIDPEALQEAKDLEGSAGKEEFLEELTELFTKIPPTELEWIPEGKLAGFYRIRLKTILPSLESIKAGNLQKPKDFELEPKPDEDDIQSATDLIANFPTTKYSKTAGEKSLNYQWKHVNQEGCTPDESGGVPPSVKAMRKTMGDKSQAREQRPYPYLVWKPAPASNGENQSDNDESIPF